MNDDTAIQPEPRISIDDIQHAERLVGLTFTEDERELMREDVEESLTQFEQLRTVSLPNHVPPLLRLDPAAPMAVDAHDDDVTFVANFEVDRPLDLEDVAFWSISELSALIRSHQVTSLELTEMYLHRLKRYDPALYCVVTSTEDLAREQAAQADRELAAGRYRGPLHGIPWGAKDLLAVREYPTTWGAMPYQDQVLDVDATVVQRLQEAGAVLVAKLSLGALAWGDVWFGGKTRTPWNLRKGSSGSSAGSAAATSAGLVGFTIGSETYGSIVSPCTRCGVSGLRPTFGRVSRYGAMALSWSMDKLGPIGRTVADCALVFAAIHGGDGRDPSAVTQPFSWSPGRFDLTTLRIGYLVDDFERDYDGRENDAASLETLRSLGVTLIPIRLPDYPISSLSLILTVEAAAAFDSLTRSNRDDELVRQSKDAWPNVLRASRLVPAVEYVQANRVRTLLRGALDAILAEIDLYLSPSLAGDNLLLTNLTGHPAVVIPNGFDEEGMPTSITFTGRYFEEDKILAVAHALQMATSYHTMRPPLAAR